MATVKAPKWDLSDLYNGLNDPRLEKDIKNIKNDSLKFEKAYRGQISHNISAAELLNIIKKYESIIRTMTKLGAYVHLIYSTHTDNQKYGAWLQKIRLLSTDVNNNLLFFELAILDLPRKKLFSLMKDPSLAGYKHYLKKQIDQKPHRLSEKQESILNKKSLTGRQAFIRLFTQTAAARRYHVKTGGKDHVLTESAVLDLMYSPDRKQRRQASIAAAKTLTNEASLNSFIFNTLAADHAINNGLRKFSTPEAARHLDNEVDQSTVDTLAETVSSNYNLVQEYYHFKRQLLGYSELYEYDRYCPVVKTVKTFAFKEAQEIILSSFRDFSPLFADIAKKFFDNKWIDAAPKAGKQGGAYCMYSTPDIHPYVFMNYSGNINDVVTLAHELGHGVHGYLAKEQSHLHYDWPLTLSETASVFAEMLVFQSLKKELTSDKQKLSLYCSRIEAMFATVFRQISMYKFEQEFHRAYSENGELSTEEINRLWRQAQQNMFGRSVALTHNEDIRWSYIPHFVHTPFYVYSYAFGELLTLSLYSMYEHNSGNFVENYINLLKAGGSASVQDLLQPFKVDIHSRSFWQGGIDEIKTLIAEAKQFTKNKPGS